MNDRYLYRGRSVDNGAWVEGNRIDDGVTGQVFIHAVGNSVNESDKVGEEGCLQFVAFEIDPSTICQCTGAQDKNGKLIFEHDIVSDEYGNMAEIIWNDAELQYLVDYEFEPMILGKWCSVIGNVFDNPELLESKGCD